METIEGSKAITKNFQYLPDDDKDIEMLLEEDDILREEFDESILDKSDAELETIEDELYSKISEGDVENIVFYEEITDESETNWETCNNMDIHSEISEEDSEISETLDKVEQHTVTLEGDFNEEDYVFYEEIMDESDADWETIEDKEVYSKISKGDIESLETIDKVDQPMEMLEKEMIGK